MFGICGDCIRKTKKVSMEFSNEKHCWSSVTLPEIFYWEFAAFVKVLRTHFSPILNKNDEKWMKCYLFGRPILSAFFFNLSNWSKSQSFQKWQNGLWLFYWIIELLFNSVCFIGVSCPANNSEHWKCTQKTSERWKYLGWWWRLSNASSNFYFYFLFHFQLQTRPFISFRIQSVLLFQESFVFWFSILLLESWFKEFGLDTLNAALTVQEVSYRKAKEAQSDFLSKIKSKILRELDSKANYGIQEFIVIWRLIDNANRMPQINLLCIWSVSMR